MNKVGPVWRHRAHIIYVPEGLGVAFFATGAGLGLIMYILTTIEFPTHNTDFYQLYGSSPTGFINMNLILY